MEIVPLKFNIIIYISIGAPGHGKYFVDGLNTRNKALWGKINRLSKNITITCEVLGMIHSESSRLAVSFKYQWK